MKTKYVCRGLISLYVKFHSNSVVNKFTCKNLQVGGKGKRARGSFPVSPPPFKISSFMFVLRVITAKCVMLRCKI